MNSLSRLTLNQLLLLMVLLVSITIWGVLEWEQQAHHTTYQQLIKKQNIVETKLEHAFGFIRDTFSLKIQLAKQFATANNQSNQVIDRRIDQLQYQLEYMCIDLLFSESCQRIRSILTNLQTYPVVVEKRYIDEQLNLLVQQSDNLVANIFELLAKHQIDYQHQENTLNQQKNRYLFLILCIGVLAMMGINYIFISPITYLSTLVRHVANTPKFHSLRQANRTMPEMYHTIEADIQKLQKQYHKLDDLRNAMLRHAAHELKTPLASVNEGCALLDEEVLGDLNPSQKEVVSLLATSAQRLNILVERLLDYNALLQQVAPKFEETSLTNIVADCIRDNKLALDQVNMSPEVDIQASVIHSDAELLRRIFDNLVSNALAHGKQQYPILIKTYTDEDKVILEVANFGEPLPVDAAATLFQPFTRGVTERNDTVVGAGLGLSIVDECARLLEGYVSLVNVSYAPVCFRVVLPSHGGVNGH